MFGDIVLGTLLGFAGFGVILGIIYFAIQADDPHWDIVADIRGVFRWLRRKVEKWGQ